jgi:hypothetical protein
LHTCSDTVIIQSGVPLQKERIFVFASLAGLVALVVVLYLPQFASVLGYSGSIAFLSDLTFMDKTMLLLTYALAFFGGVEGFSVFKRAAMEDKRNQIEDARNELEKAYGPLYMILNKPSKSGEADFWLDFEERRRIEEILATYPFMFPPNVTELWQHSIRGLAESLGVSDLESAKRAVSCDGYLELKKIINELYVLKVKGYRELLAK